MTAYNLIVNELLEKDLGCQFYRFQGSSSFEYYNIKKNNFDYSSDHYVYFSRTKNHHYYFTIRRIRQLINAVVLKDTPYIISNKGLNNKESFSSITNLIINSNKVRNLNSIILVCDNNYYKLLKENSINNNLKENQRLIERVDRRIYGGGYGISSLWLKLLDDLTFFSSYDRITTKDILNLLESMRERNSLTVPYLMSDILDKKIRNYKIKNNIYNDFHKYNIMNDLEQIVDLKLYLKNSSFAVNPSITIKEILNSYQKKREKILSLVDRSYHKY